MNDAGIASSSAPSSEHNGDLLYLLDEVAHLKKRNDDLVIAIAAMGELLRRIDHTLNLGSLSERLPIGVFDVVVDTDDGQQHPPALNMAVDVAGTNVRIRFNNGIGKHHQRE